MSTHDRSCWLPTGQAAAKLGVSAATLKRYAIRDQFLIEGQHWRPGAHHNSPYLWEVNGCHQALLHWGRKQRTAGPELSSSH